MKEKKDYVKIAFVVAFFIVLLVASFLYIHNIEATIHVRCDGKPVFPMDKDARIVTGKMKLDNAITVNLFNDNIDLYEPIEGDSLSFIKFRKGCIYQTTGRWMFR